MSLIYAYYGETRVHIEDYDPSIHKAKISCAGGEPVIAKRGNIKIHHYAHKQECGCWGGGEMTEWHRNWQARFPRDQQEVIVRTETIMHIADIKTLAGLVIEFQHSSINEETVLAREVFYEKMIWVFDCTETGCPWPYRKKNESQFFSASVPGIGITYKHNRDKRRWMYCHTQVYLDIGDDCCIIKDGPSPELIRMKDFYKLIGLQPTKEQMRIWDMFDELELLRYRHATLLTQVTTDKTALRVVQERVAHLESLDGAKLADQYVILDAVHTSLKAEHRNAVRQNEQLTSRLRETERQHEQTVKTMTLEYEGKLVELRRELKCKDKTNKMNKQRAVESARVDNDKKRMGGLLSIAIGNTQ